MVLEQRMEGVVPNPRLIPEHVLTEVSDLLQHLLDVVDGSVIRRELDACEPKGSLCLVTLWVLHERILADLLAKVIFVPSVPIDSADHAERIARGGKKNRDCASLD